MLHAADTREAARDHLIERWDRDRQANPDASRIILTHTNAEVRELNEAARGALRASGDLGDNVRIKTERGKRDFAAGDRIMFRSEKHTSELQSLMSISYAVLCLNKDNTLYLHIRLNTLSTDTHAYKH